MKIFEVGESAVCIEFGPQIDLELNEAALEYAARLESLEWPQVLEIVPAYSSVTVYLTDTKIDRLDMITRLKNEVPRVSKAAKSNARIHCIPVVYGGDYGPDLEDVAQLNNTTADEVVRIHTHNEFRVFMLGFMPGFPYCGIVPEKIRAPRLATPRIRVTQGSVGIAGAQTGIYPIDSPGGWRIIGRTPTRLFDPTASREKMFLFQPGDHIQFRSIRAEEFHAGSN